MSFLCENLLAWYRPEKRAMPWRGERDPYAVWVSEIMLQQTRVETVREYFKRFMARFPDVRALAGAPGQDVLKAWEGLGYYTRARNLHKAAKAVAASPDGFPRDVEGWAALPGVGPYTAASIASICDGIAAPVVDGNVIRVFARFLARGDDFRKPPNRARLAAWLRPFVEESGRPGDFNQAMMDLGATCCTPREPSCGACPLAAECKARIAGAVARFPFRPPKKALPTREAVAFLVRDSQGRVLFRRRPPEGLLGGLWELPNVEPALSGPRPRPSSVPGNPLAGVDLSAAFRYATGGTAGRVRFARTVTHVFTHFRLLFHVCVCEKASGISESPGALLFAVPDSLPLATATRRALETV
jgi:A/G-specific adenine glycosylase